MRGSSSGFVIASALGLAAAFAACSDEGDGSSSTDGSGAGNTGGAPTSGSTSGPSSTSTSTGTSSAVSSSSGSASSSSGSSSGGGGSGGGVCGPLPFLTEPPATLSETGLYDDIANDVIAVHAKPFQPLYPLWSDDAAKERWFYIPECEQVDTSDMDTWQVPVGARLWKQFTRDGVRIETRLIMRTGPGQSDFEFATYQWTGDEAFRVQNGVIDANGTDHDIPPQTMCSNCHRKDWRILGFSAIQLTHSLPGETMASLSAAGLLTNPLPGGVVIPGNPVDQAGLGYLHANCGSCHFDGGVPNPPISFKVLQAHTTVESTDTYTTCVNQAANFNCNCDRIEPGDAAASAVIQRMSVRTGDQMPPFATEVVDNDGVAAVSAFIDQLPP